MPVQLYSVLHQECCGLIIFNWTEVVLTSSLRDPGTYQYNTHSHGFTHTHYDTHYEEIQLRVPLEHYNPLLSEDILSCQMPWGMLDLYQ